MKINKQTWLSNRFQDGIYLLFPDHSDRRDFGEQFCLLDTTPGGVNL